MYSISQENKKKQQHSIASLQAKQSREDSHWNTPFISRNESPYCMVDGFEDGREAARHQAELVLRNDDQTLFAVFQPHLAMPTHLPSSHRQL